MQSELLSLVCDTSPDSTGSKSELLNTAYVASARMHIAISRCSMNSCACGSRTQQLTLTATLPLLRNLPCCCPVCPAPMQLVEWALKHSILAIWVAKANFLSTKIGRNNGCGLLNVFQITGMLGVQISDLSTVHLLVKWVDLPVNGVNLHLAAWRYQNGMCEALLTSIVIQCEMKIMH